MSSSLLRTAALGAAAALLLAGCAPTPGQGGGGNTISVVASTNVYGDLAQTIGGDRVHVTAIVSKPTQDPHSYEATTQDRLAVSKARLVIENGGGYDPFMDSLLADARPEASSVLNAVEASGLGGGVGGSGEAAPSSAAPSASAHTGHAHAFNEHVWYDLHAMEAVVTAIAERLGALDPSSAADFTERATAVAKRLEAAEGTLAAVRQAHSGKGAVLTEPVPSYLLENAGLKDATPSGFLEAVEEEQDVPPAVLKSTLDLLAAKGVAVLAYNPQTESPQTKQVRAAAEAAGVPVVEFTETLPQGTDYAGWMQGNADALAKALG
ncbi:metal ABC transporter solute-binding protein, Zn/Mn family [Sinomonas flava]|uniref:Zinc ABC transporter substrate-binding protein n=1 Tax=Sinomonas flava TaxID=496857 RepID=A0ABP5NEJ4_9MICC